MPSKRPSTDYGKLSDDFAKLKVAGWEPIQPNESLDYPEELVLIPADGTETDEAWKAWYAYCARLLEQAYETEPKESNGAVLLQKTSDRGRRGRRMALFRIEGTVYQISSIQPHRRHTEVLGRMGVVTIILEQLEERFRRRNQPRTLTVADLARLTANNENSVATTEKLLSNLNSGHFVIEQNLRNVAEALGVCHKDLCFSTRSLYKPDALKSRAANARKRAQEAHDRLKSFSPKLKRLVDASEKEIFEKLLCLPEPRNQIEYKFLPNDTHKAEVVEAFIDLIRSMHRFDLNAVAKICMALRALETANVWVWFGEYEVGLEYLDEFDTWGWSEPRLVLAFGNRDGATPPVRVNLFRAMRDKSVFPDTDQSP
jgi:hypothetical protein